MTRSAHFRTTAAAHAAGALVAMALATYMGFALFALARPDLDVDEGRYGIAALNILADYRQLATVSMTPGGGPFDKPYAYPLALAASVAILGKTDFALRIVSVLALALSTVLIYRTMRHFTGEPLVGAVTAAVFAVNAGTITYARFALPEPLVMLFGCVALYFLSRYDAAPRALYALAIGIALGGAFLSKLWLSYPFVLAVLSYFGVVIVRERARRHVLHMALAVGALACTGLSHVALVLLLTPGDLSHWLNMYFVFAFKSRIGGASYDPQMWIRSWWFYAAATFKATFFVLPFLLDGVPALARHPSRKLQVIALSLLTPIALLSLFTVKQASYMYAAYPALCLLVALGVARSGYTARPPSLAASIASVIIALLAHSVGVIRAHELLLMAGLYGAYVVAAIAARWNRVALVRVAVTGSVAAALIGAWLGVSRTLEHQSGYRHLAPHIQAYLGVSNPRTFVAPEYPVLEFYTFRSGEYWGTFYERRPDDELVALITSGGRDVYVVDPSSRLYGSVESHRVLATLDAHAVNITPDIEHAVGRTLPVRVFVSRAAYANTLKATAPVSHP